jgi:hypothetical protein
MARVTLHLGGRERLEARISKATPLGAWGTEALVYLGATCFRVPPRPFGPWPTPSSRRPTWPTPTTPTPRASASASRPSATSTADRPILRRPGRQSPGPPQPPSQEPRHASHPTAPDRPG